MPTDVVDMPEEQEQGKLTIKLPDSADNLRTGYYKHVAGLLEASHSPSDEDLLDILGSFNIEKLTQYLSSTKEDIPPIPLHELFDKAPNYLGKWPVINPEDLVYFSPIPGHLKSLGLNCRVETSRPKKSILDSLKQKGENGVFFGKWYTQIYEPFLHIAPIAQYPTGVVESVETRITDGIKNLDLAQKAVDYRKKYINDRLLLKAPGN